MGTDCTSLFADNEFRRLLAQTARGCIPWEKFLGLPQPRGMSPLDTWRLLSDIGSVEGIAISVPSLDGDVWWYRRTHELSDAVMAISSACQAGSRLHRVMTGGFGQQFLLASRIAETISAAQLDGIVIADEDADVLLRMDRTPRTDAERLLLNTFEAFEVLPSLVEEPFSVALLTRFRDMLLRGVDPDLLVRQAPMSGLMLGIENPHPEEQPSQANEQLEHIAKYLNRDTSDVYDMPVLQGQVMVDALRYSRACGIVSCQVGCLAAGLFAIKNDLPVLSLLPISRAKVGWEMGRIKPPAVSLDRDAKATLRERSPLDATPHQTLIAELILFSLRELTWQVYEWEKRDEEMRSFLKHDPMLNHRQRSILGRALRSPDAEFKIQYHKTNHNIHYATARRDLFELKTKGYLDVAKRGRTYVFTRGPALMELAATSAIESSDDERSDPE